MTAQEPTITLNLPKSTVEAAVNALAKQPWIEANGHIQMIMAQANTPKMVPAAAPVDANSAPLPSA